MKYEIKIAGKNLVISGSDNGSLGFGRDNRCKNRVWIRHLVEAGYQVAQEGTWSDGDKVVTITGAGDMGDKPPVQIVTVEDLDGDRIWLTEARWTGTKWVVERIERKVQEARIKAENAAYAAEQGW